ncbi:MAG: cyclin-domain-containing protein [Benjaminiella poitrasii]|nr:MAG: cyclin-domain-containing protein [Benjaminiella poitrasii]
MPVPHNSDYYNYCYPYTNTSTDPNLYSLKNNTSKVPNQNIASLPSLASLVNNNEYSSHSGSFEERSVMIDKLLDASADIVDSIWFNNTHSSTLKMMSTSSFIREILKRSRATYSMLQLALFYIFRIKGLIHEQMHRSDNNHHNFARCGRRMFLASLMVSSKYLNDKNYRNRTWAKIASLPITEINNTEFMFLKLINYQLYVSKPFYEKWVSLLHDYIQRKNYVQPIIKPLPLRFETEFPCLPNRFQNYQYHGYMNNISSSPASLSSFSSSSDESTASNTPYHNDTTHTPQLLLPHGKKRPSSTPASDNTIMARKSLRKM